MKKLFLLSGLGADKRVFGFLELTEFELHYIAWAKPFPGESLSEYAKRLLPQITEDKPILLGVSFGGMIAQEIAKLIPVERVILISSARSGNAIPSYLKFMFKLKIQKFLPVSRLKKPNEVLYWLFGITSNRHKALLASIMADTDEHFLVWAIEAIPEWKNNTIPPNHIVQIHGSDDKILRFQTADYVIHGGGHLMIVTRAKEISEIIKQVLAAPV
jgi:pimeloyl-ACP methyl ester carboxylesterase